MDEKIINLIKETFKYYKQNIINKDIFDPTNDCYIINQWALSDTACELEMDKKNIADILGII